MMMSRKSFVVRLLSGLRSASCPVCSLSKWLLYPVTNIIMIMVCVSHNHSAQKQQPKEREWTWRKLFSHLYTVISNTICIVIEGGLQTKWKSNAYLIHFCSCKHPTSQPLLFLLRVAHNPPKNFPFQLPTSIRFPQVENLLVLATTTSYSQQQ